MSYSITASGKKADALEKVKSSIASQSAGMSAKEKSMLDGDAKDIDDMAAQYAGEDDTVSVTLAGSFSQGDGTGFGISRTLGLTIEKNRKKANAAPAAAEQATGTGNSTGSGASTASK